MSKLTLKDLEARVGQEVGLSPWMEMTQDQINAFAEATGDRQWIHVDEEQARRSPLRSTVAHGYLLVALLAPLNFGNEIFQQKFRMAINYGLDHVRFLQPVRPGDRIRNRAMLKRIEKQGLRKVLVVLENTLEIESKDKPALVADTLALIYL